MDFSQASALYHSVLDNFYVDKEGGYFRETAPEKEGDRKTCYLWSYFAATGMIYRAYQAGMDVLPFYRKVLDGFAYYRSAPIGEEMIKYHSERGDVPNGGSGPCFFDDNIWVARNYLFAYEVFGDAFYLDEARRIVNYIYTGWNEELGGLVWNEKGLTADGTEQELERGLSANACCSIVNALLYRLTGQEAYLAWAQRFYDFCKTTQDPVTKIYYNGVHTLLVEGRRAAGPVNRDLYSYNSGSMILADLLLYEITGERSYYTDALAAAKAAHEAFLRQDEKSGLSYYQDFDWFTAILAEAFSALAVYDREAVRPYIGVLLQALDYSLTAFPSETGLLPHDYVTGWRKEDAYDRMLLTHSGTAEIALLLAAAGR
jgi:hypothetical protein